jgi:hypothetical protein
MRNAYPEYDRGLEQTLDLFAGNLKGSEPA